MSTGPSRGAIAAAPYLFTVGFFLLWEAVCRLLKVPQYFLPAPNHAGLRRLGDRRIQRLPLRHR